MEGSFFYPSSTPVFQSMVAMVSDQELYRLSQILNAELCKRASRAYQQTQTPQPSYAHLVQQHPPLPNEERQKKHEEHEESQEQAKTSFEELPNGVHSIRVCDSEACPDKWCSFRYGAVL